MIFGRVKSDLRRDLGWLSELIGPLYIVGENSAGTPPAQRLHELSIGK